MLPLRSEVFTCIPGDVNQTGGNIRGVKKIMQSIVKIACAAATALIMCANAYAGSLENGRRLVDALDMETQLEQTITQAITQAKQQLYASGGASMAQINQVADALEAEMRASAPALLDELAQIYANQFTDKELDDLVEFYESPTGQKYAASQSALGAAQASATEQWMQGVSERAMSRLFGS